MRLVIFIKQYIKILKMMQLEKLMIAIKLRENIPLILMQPTLQAESIFTLYIPAALFLLKRC